ncbi:PAS domain S-box protein [Desulfosporosinus sp. SB140]|uniref:PAS domain-containing hybrid sensor histidine kinase/response regulator n=1 Tax=Desulfosporosinus paludis TaxID=3115649 RepID=UPI00388E4FB3
MLVIMQELIVKIQTSEGWLVQQLAVYLKKRGYTKYTSTLIEAWRLTIAGLSDSIISCLMGDVSVNDFEFDVDQEADGSSSASIPIDKLIEFALTEAERYRQHGVTLTMFIGLLKYCRYTYLDLITASFELPNRFTYCRLMNCSFDRIEMAITSRWLTEDEPSFINNLKESNRLLANGKNKYLTVFESIPVPVLLLGPNKEIDNLNLAAAALFADSPSPGTQYYGTPIQNTTLLWLVDELDNLKENNSTLIKDLVTIYGIRTFVVSLNHLCDISGKFNGFVVILNDVTEANRIAEAHDFYLQILNDFPCFIWRTDAQGNVNYFNSNLRRFLGLDEHSLDIINWTYYVRPDQRAIVLSAFKSAFQTRCYCQQQFQARRFDGQYIWLQNSGVPYYDAHGEFEGFIGIGQDITEQKRAIEDLQRSEEDYRLLVQHLPDAILVHNGYEVIFANSAAHKLFGHKDIVRYPVEALIHPDFLPTARRRIKLAIEQGAIGELLEQIIMNDRGELIDVEGTLVPMTYRGQRVIQVVLRDITERKKQAEQAIRQSKLESLGLLAGGIAHDFNNILTIIVGNISLIKHFKLADDKISNMLIDIEQAALNAKSLTSQLLTFAKGGAPQKQVLNLGKLVAAGTHFALSGANVNCELSIPPDLWFVEADGSQLNQVINNIVINAKEAMLSGGTLTVKAENYLDTDSQPPKRWVRLTFLDNGPGIPTEILAKIFDPYFTTKDTGSGLGLTTAYSIIAKHNGTLTVQSSLGNGAIFNICLQAVDSGTPSLSQSTSQEDVKFGSGEKILVMDDEANVREITGAMLAHLGFRSDFAQDGKEMLFLYQNALVLGTPYIAVIMDLTVPGGLGGKDAIRELLTIDVNARAIVASGYSDDLVMSKYADYGFCGCLRKPYLLEELGQSLQRVLSLSRNEII